MKAIKYILLVTVFLFVLVFLITIPGRNRASQNSSETTAGTTAETTPASSSAAIGTTIENGTSAIVVGGEPLTSETTAPGTSAAGTTASGTAVSGSSAGTSAGDKSMEKDNAWAFILINQTNPLPESYTFTTKPVQGTYQMDDRCADFMISMIDDAKTAGIRLTVLSAYRSIEKQQTLLDNDIKSYQKQGYSYDDAYVMASKAVAIPGQSEHNAGICADLCSLSQDFEDTKEFEWLSENAYKYGFILRYPKGKETLTGIQYEPWHYRFVGTYHAAKIRESGLCLEEYFAQQTN